jgi:hypothetical protein
MDTWKPMNQTYIPKEDTASLTVLTEATFIRATIAAHE